MWISRPTCAPLSGKLPILYVLREDWSRLARTWIEANTPDASVEVFGKHLMFWEQADRFNRILDEFLGRIA